MSLRRYCTENVALLEKVLASLVATVEADSGFVQRRSKVSSLHFVRTLVLGQLQTPGPTLNNLVQVSASLGVPLTAPGLDQRINERAVRLLQDLLQVTLQHCRAVGHESRLLTELFPTVRILDSTQIPLPPTLQAQFPACGGAGPQAAAKLQLSYDYGRGELAALELQPARCPDQKYPVAGHDFVAGCLHLFDLGYFQQKALADLDAADGYFVTPLQRQVALYWQKDDAQKLDLLAYLQQQTDAVVTLTVYLGHKVRLPVRVLATRLSPEALKKRRERARRDNKRRSTQRRKRKLSLRHLQLLGWDLLVTNVPADRADAGQVQLLYRLRWQVELLFKLWKSHARLLPSPHWRRDRTLCHIYAQLIGLILFHHLATPCQHAAGQELSLVKALTVLRLHLPAIITAIRRSGYGLRAALARLYHALLRFARKDARTKNPSTRRQIHLAYA